jgi:hypothetical protein
MTVADTQTKPVGVGLIGAGWIGTFHGETLARRLPGARLAGIADPAPGRGREAGQLARGRPGDHRPGRAAGRPGRGGGADRRPRPLPRRPGRGRRRGRQGGVLREAHGPHPGRRRPGHRRHPGLPPSSGTRASRTPRWSWPASTTGPWPRPRPASTPCTATTSAARSSARPAWPPPATSAAPPWPPRRRGRGGRHLATQRRPVPRRLHRRAGRLHRRRPRGATLSPDGHDARAALAIALAAIASVDTGQPVRPDTVQQP